MGEAILREITTPSKVVDKQEILANFHLPTQLKFKIEREEFLLLSVKTKEERGKARFF